MASNLGKTFLKTHILTPPRNEVKKDTKRRKRHGYCKKAICGIASQMNLDCPSVKKMQNKRKIIKAIMSNAVRLLFFQRKTIAIKENAESNKCIFPILKDNPSKHP